MSDPESIADDARARRIVARGKTPDVDRVEATVDRPIAVIVLASLAASAVPLLLLDPQANDGAALMIGAFGIPMLAVALIVQICMSALGANRSIPRRVLWWPLAVLPIGTLLLTVPGLITYPEYFETYSFWSTVGTVLLFVVLIAIAELLGALVWFFLVFPFAMIVSAVRALARGERVWFRLIPPLVILALTAVILFGAASVDDLLPGRAGGGQIVAAVLGIPGSYTVVWEPGLWVVRAILVGLGAWWAVGAVQDRRRRDPR